LRNPREKCQRVIGKIFGPSEAEAHANEMYGIFISLYTTRQLLKRKKLTKKVKIHMPVAHTQIDVRHLDPMRNESKRYVFNFVDHASK